VNRAACLTASFWTLDVMAPEVQVSPGGSMAWGITLCGVRSTAVQVLTDAVRARCEELIRAKAGGQGWRIVALEVMPDHVHLFVKTHPADCPSYVPY
jgi:putative transposase